MGIKDILNTKSVEMQEAVRQAPLLPGCYIYRNNKQKIIYIGKAKVLRNRVKSYFLNYDRVEPKTQQMVDTAVSIEFIPTDSEIEALILENILIKKHKPKYNIMLRDDKSYVYVEFTHMLKQPRQGTRNLPTIKITREKKDPHSIYYGPYPSAVTIKRLLYRLRKTFKYCLEEVKFTLEGDQIVVGEKQKPCFNYQVGACSGGCAGLVSYKEYMKNLLYIEKIFQAKKESLITELTTEMTKAAKQQDFEEAAKLRNIVNDIKYVGHQLTFDRDSDELSVMASKIKQKEEALAELIQELKFPTEKLQPNEETRIECYDISNIQGKFAVGSMVVAVGGQARPDLYRRFRIKMKNEPNDFGMMKEMLTRRFAQYLRSQEWFTLEAGEYQPTDNEGFTINLKEIQKQLKSWKPDPSFSQLPDLIIIDGGKGQLSSAFTILSQFRLETQVPIVGLAKREEEIFKVNEQFSENQGEWGRVYDSALSQIMDSGYTKVRLGKRSQALYLVQRIRDEAHRFAITYHRKVRAKNFIVDN